MHLSESDIISEADFIQARNSWLSLNPFFERAVDSQLNLPLPPTLDEARNKVIKARENIKNFEYDNYVYSVFTKKSTGQTVYGKLPMYIERSLEAKVIYIGLNAPDELRKELKEYARSHGIEIYDMVFGQGQKYCFIPKKIVL